MGVALVYPFIASLIRGYLIIAGVLVICLVLVFVIDRLFPISAELQRKLIHFTAVGVFITWLYAFPDWKTSVFAMILAAAAVTILLLLLEKTSVFPILSKLTNERKQGELRKSIAAAGLMFVIVASVCWGYFGQRSLALACILAWGPGDAAAALVGKRFGKMKIGRTKKKSLEGSLSMFATSWICVFLVLLGYRVFPFLTALAVSFVTAFVTAVVELEVLSGYDTLFCPLAAMVVLCLGYFLAGIS